MIRTIRARIHETAVKRVTRIYAATPGRHLRRDPAEQPPRRTPRGCALRFPRRPAGPRERHSGNRCEDAPLIVTVFDNGAGIADPALLLSFGENGWDDALVRREDAAGFGFASLARRRNCTVSSQAAFIRRTDGIARLAGPADARALSRGTAAAEVHADDEAPYPWGTSISFDATEAIAAVPQRGRDHAARHLPAAGSCSRTAPRTPRRRFRNSCRASAFLDGAGPCRAPGAGLVFGVFQEPPCSGYNDPRPQLLRPHPAGRACRRSRPSMARPGPCWRMWPTVPNLELVLPARKEAVENAFLTEMREAARLAVYRAHGGRPLTAPGSSRTGRGPREAGIDMAPPPAVSCGPGGPASPTADDWRESARPTEAFPDASAAMPWSWAATPEPPEAQALWRARRTRRHRTAPVRGRPPARRLWLV